MSHIKYNQDTIISKVKTKEELLQLLKDYKSILSEEAYSFLQQLINLNQPVTGDSISEANKEILSKLGLYRYIAIYNIYTTVLNYFNQQQLNDFSLKDNEQNFNGLKVRLESCEQNCEKGTIFNFTYPQSTENAPSEIGTIDLYKTIIKTEEQIRAEIAEIDKQIKDLENTEYPYFPSYRESKECLVGEPIATWRANAMIVLSDLEERKQKLEKLLQLTYEERERRSRIKNQYYYELLKILGLHEENFEEEIVFKSLAESSQPNHKRRVRKLPGGLIVAINNNN